MKKRLEKSIFQAEFGLLVFCWCLTGFLDSFRCMVFFLLSSLKGRSPASSVTKTTRDGELRLYGSEKS